MVANLSSAKIVRVDEGRINSRIIAREAKADYRRIEAASIKKLVCLSSAQGKRMFVRHFVTLQLHVHFIAVFARTRLDSDELEKVEEAIRSQLNTVHQSLLQAIDGIEHLFKEHGISTVATYDNQPLEIEVGVISSIGRRYLESIEMFDQLMPCFQTLEIYEVLTPKAIDTQVALLKRALRNVSVTSRRFALGLSRRMNEVALAAASQGLGETEISENLTAQEEGRTEEAEEPGVPE